MDAIIECGPPGDSPTCRFKPAELYVDTLALSHREAQILHYFDHPPVYATGEAIQNDRLSAWVDPQLMVPSLASPDRMGAIKELVDRMHRADWVDDSLSFLQAVVEREDLQSTVFDSGVAFPHARSRSVRRLGAAIGLSHDGINFGSAGHPQIVHLVCLFAVPAHESDAYLPFLAALSGRLANPDVRADLTSCSTPDAMFHHVTNANHGKGMLA